ncbi:gliding motility lipoprotein GldJ [Elizabethkingia sp. JS20170427COW]|uniref:gliding motility lipoprotein GldJ n=1 Tax=Elizabethkingia sp. JS20170427COW TaxID=2583851 RepID=UPI0011107590|nr:gliding motility lipoprotein GldJ [Elizabethkingia sp. JS20170427COW]QCX53864.1 gliding motility lipoprotein GldJ [Elizabethkingia sp. JS20170427COW]
MNKLKLFAYVVCSSAFVLTSCGGGNTKRGGGSGSTKSLTGWKPNDSKGWMFTQKQQKQKGWPGMVFVGGGTFTMGLVKDDVMHDWNNTPRRMQVSSFFIGETEITNYDYRSYVTWLKIVFPPSDPQFKEIYNGALPDTLVWNSKLSRNDYAETYFRSPEYDNYPVVGVSWLQATKYCDWLTDRANEKALMDQGVISRDFYVNDANNQGANAFNLDKFKANDPEMQNYINEKRLAQKSGVTSKNARIVAANRNATSGVVQKFRLPTEVEWEYAALGLQKDRNYNNYLGKTPEIDQLKGKKGRYRGMYLENFKQGRGDYSGVGGWPNDGAPTTADVKQYPSNDLGIYGMFGNVAEWTADIYRPIIDEEANDFNYFRGNVTREVEKNPDGTYKVIEGGNIKYDTLADGRLIYRGLPGQYQRQIVSNDGNFRDGDFMSSLEAGYGREAEEGQEVNMYNSPKVKYIVDANGKVILQKDSKQRTSAISDHVRVVKGGSWLDSAYWLDPGQRRFKNENKGFGWIGFRVAQDAKDQNKRSRR